MRYKQAPNKTLKDNTIKIEKSLNNLNGNSGCQLLLCGEEPNFFVRKISSSKSYNTRLKKQYIKQTHFSLNFYNVMVPKIIGHGYYNDKFYFDMQYIRSKTLADSIENLSLEKIDLMIDFLISFFPFGKEVYNPQKSQNAFHKKINSLGIFLEQDSLYKKALNKLEAFDFSNVPNSYCCGDLTLENILISNEGNIYLIDFLDSFYNSWMIDAAKILQDVDLFWSYRKKDMSTNLKIRLLILKQKFLSKIAAQPKGEHICLQIYYILLLNIIRIVPYCKDKQTFDFLQISIEKILNTINNMEN